MSVRCVWGHASGRTGGAGQGVCPVGMDESSGMKRRQYAGSKTLGM